MTTIIIPPKPNHIYRDIADEGRARLGLPPGAWALVVEGDSVWLLLDDDVWCWRADPT